MTYREEFPDFPESDMPAIPASYEDESWGNEMCPCFRKALASGRFITLWIDFLDPLQREITDGLRFGITLADANGTNDAAGYQTDDFAALLAEAARVENLGGHWT